MSLKLGDPVVFVDGQGNARGAIVTAIWGKATRAEERVEKSGHEPLVLETEDAAPSINLAFVSGDRDRRDNYGRQIERATSVVHASNQGANGYYWRRLDEAGKETERAA